MTNRIFDLIQLQNANRGLLWTEEDKEEFAALVVLACAKVSGDDIYISNGDACCTNTADRIAKQIKQHFEVEE